MWVRFPRPSGSGCRYLPSTPNTLAGPRGFRSWRRPATSCGEENLLCFPGDPYATENILIHEFGHTIHEIGLAQADPTFQKRLDAAFAAAGDHGRWRDTYGRTNAAEYWAEGVQSWFSCNRTHDRAAAPTFDWKNLPNRD